MGGPCWLPAGGVVGNAGAENGVGVVLAGGTVIGGTVAGIELPGATVVGGIVWP